MRLTSQSNHSLIDIPPVQADRLGLPEFERALQSRRFNPFPTGLHSVGQTENRGSTEKNPITEESDALIAPVLSSFDGGLPDYIQEALVSGLHQDDSSLRDFLAIFDRRILELQVRAERARLLVSHEDSKGTAAANLLGQLLQSVSCGDKDRQTIEILLPLLSKCRSLEMLRRIIEWRSGRAVKVTARFGKRYPIDENSRTLMSASTRKASQALGKGTLLGKSGQTPIAHIEVRLACKDRADLRQLSQDREVLEHLKNICVQYLRDAAPLTIFADVCRSQLRAPKLSARRPTDRLGMYSLLSPHRSPNVTASIKLIDRAF